jgi:hypothetical protein
MRRRPQPWIGLLLAALLCWQSGVAAAHCLRLAQGAGMEICTPDGMRRIALDDPEESGRDGLNGRETFCFACHAITTPAPPTPGAASEPVLWSPAATPVPVAETLLRPPPRGPPLPPRAPPALT